MSLHDAIERNRQRHANKRAGIKPQETLRPYRVNVLVIPPNYMIDLGLATVHRETKTIYGTSLADAKQRAGIE
jgi:hypothetical protein